MHLRGSAIIAALLVVALVAVIASKALVLQQTSVNQAIARSDYDIARETANAGLHWARAVLYDDGRRSSIDHMGEAWAQSTPPTEVGNAVVSGYIEDAQGRFDVNSLAISGKIDSIALRTFSRLLRNLDLPIELANSAADWLDTDGELISQQSAESAYYLALQPAYRPSGVPFGSIEELHKVRYFSPVILEKLRPFIIVLPKTVPININTASPELLAAIIPSLGLGDAQRIAEERTRSPYSSSSDFIARFPSGADTFPVTVQSQFFLVHGSVRHNESYIQTTALLQRQDTKWPQVIWQRQE